MLTQAKLAKKTWKNDKFEWKLGANIDILKLGLSWR